MGSFKGNERNRWFSDTGRMSDLALLGQETLRLLRLVEGINLMFNLQFSPGSF